MPHPPLDVVLRTVDALRGAGIESALGGSGLLLALGLVDEANDWDLTTEADADAVGTALDAAGLPHRDATESGGVWASARRIVVDGGDHEIDVIVRYALRGPDGVVPVPTRVTGHWRGLPLGDPSVWRTAYVLMGRTEKAARLAGYT